MIVILRRGAARRRARALAKSSSTPNQIQALNNSNKPLSFFPAFFVKKSSDKSLEPETSHNLPEPDLESLASTNPRLAEPEFPSNTANIPSPPNWPIIPVLNEQIITSSALEPVSAESKELSVSPSKLSDPAGAVEIMRVWRDLGDGSLMIELDGQRFRAPREIGSAELARRFVNVVRELWTMVNTGMPIRASNTGSNADLSEGNTRASGISLAAPGGSVESKGGQSTLSAYTPPSPPASDLKAPGMLRAFGRTVASQAQTRPSGIADAVEDFLQFKLSNTPQFQQRNIHVRPSFDGGVRIEVDGRSYNGVGDVIDPDVRDFLTATFREWEARQ